MPSKPEIFIYTDGASSGKADAPGGWAATGRAAVRRADLVWSETPCEAWPGARDKNGYGRNGRRLAHRLTWEYAYGPIPQGMEICHHCDNPPCVNISHLFMGTRADNVRDCMNKGRFRYGHLPGAKNGNAKLTDGTAMEIIYLHAQGESSRRLAERFGVSRSTVMDIYRGRGWRHLDRSTV